MYLRSPFWGSKATKAATLLPLKKSQTLALEKPDLKSFSDFEKKIPM
jgi:hypothetical protein